MCRECWQEKDEDMDTTDKALDELMEQLATAIDNGLAVPINKATGKPVKINPATGKPFKINPKTGVPFKKKKVNMAAVPMPAPVVAVNPAQTQPKASVKGVSNILNKNLSKMDKKKFQKILDSFAQSKGHNSSKKTMSKPKVLCPDCQREWSAAMDTYYGRTEGAKERCTDCRYKRFGEY